MSFLSGFAKGLASQDPVGGYLEAKRAKREQETHDAQMDQLNYEKGKRDQVKAAGEAISGIQNYDDYNAANPAPALPPKPALSADTNGYPEGVDQAADQAKGVQYDQDKAAYDKVVTTAPKIKEYHDYVRESYEKAASKLVNDPVAAEQLRKLGKEKAYEAYMAPISRDAASGMSNEEFAAKYLEKYSKDTKNRYEVHALPGTDNFLGINRKSGAKQVMSRAEVVQQLSMLARAAGGDPQGMLAELHGMEESDLKRRQVGALETTAQAHADANTNNKNKIANEYEINKGELAIKKDQLAIMRMTAGANARLTSLQADALKGDLDAKKEYDKLIPKYNEAYQKLNDAHESGDPKAIAAAKTNFNAFEVQLSNAIRKPMQIKEQAGKTAPSFTLKEGKYVNADGVPVAQDGPLGEMIPLGVSVDLHNKTKAAATDAGLKMEVGVTGDGSVGYRFSDASGKRYRTIEDAKAAGKGNPSGISPDEAGVMATAPSALRRGQQPGAAAPTQVDPKRAALESLDRALSETGKKIATAKGPELQALLEQFKQQTEAKNRITK